MLAAITNNALLSVPLKALIAHGGALSLLRSLPTSFSQSRGLSSNGRHSSVYITDVDNNPTSHMPLLLGLVNYFERHMPYGEQETHKKMPCAFWGWWPKCIVHAEHSMQAQQVPAFPSTDTAIGLNPKNVMLDKQGRLLQQCGPWAHLANRPDVCLLALVLLLFHLALHHPSGLLLTYWRQCQP
jgi:hypothetical protein